MTPLTPPASYVLDDGKTRLVAVVESRSCVNLHLTKYGELATTLVTRGLTADEAYALGIFLIANVKPQTPTKET